MPHNEAVTDAVTLRREGNIARIVIDNPPVNSISADVLDALFAAIRGFVASEELGAAVITCAGPSFSTGAEIEELDNETASAAWKEMDRVVEDCPKPIVAAMQGCAYGGGLELALACHFRIAEEDTMFGLPEVSLGLIPGGGGTQRLPRIVGLEFALDVIPSGRVFGAPEALDNHLLDRVVPSGTLEHAALEFASQIAARGLTGDQVPRTKNRALGEDTASARRLVEAAKESVSLKWPWSGARLAAIEAVENCSRLPFPEALDKESEIFARVVASSEHRALKHLFFAERKARHVPGMRQDVPIRLFSRAGVVGGGQMGRGIALTLAAAGIPACIVETSETIAQAALSECYVEIDRAVTKGSITESEGKRRRQCLSAAADQDALAESDLIVEAVFEDLEVKKSILTSIAQITKPGTILASNTSNLNINELAAFTARPEDVIGLHFFNPAPRMRLLEIIPGDKTSPEVLKSALALAKRLRKQPVVAQVCDGFIANRLFDRYSLEAEFLVEEGVSPYDVDAALRTFGMSMGPFQTSDLVGIDVGQAIRRRQSQRLPKGVRWPRVEEKIAELGRLGQKSSAGWYSYLEGRRGQPDPVVEDVIRDYRIGNRIQIREITEKEIVDRCILAMVCEGTKILDEKIAFRASDIDVAMVHGMGFPSWRGGPMFYANEVGLLDVANQINAFSARNPFWWRSSCTLSRATASGMSFEEVEASRCGEIA